jgi:hypothetical protein
VRAAEALERTAERIALEATNSRADAHDVGPREAREALLLAGDELMASARRLRVVAAQERDRPRTVRSVRPLDGPVALGPLRLDPATREVRVAGEEVRLAGKEYALLRVLISEPRRVFTRASSCGRCGGSRPTPAFGPEPSTRTRAGFASASTAAPTATSSRTSGGSATASPTSRRARRGPDAPPTESRWGFSRPGALSVPTCQPARHAA